MTRYTYDVCVRVRHSIRSVRASEARSARRASSRGRKTGPEVEAVNARTRKRAHIRTDRGRVSARVGSRDVPSGISTRLSRTNIHTQRKATMSDQTGIATNDAQVPSDKPARKPRAKRDSFSVTDLARERLRARGIKTDARISDECKVVRGILRSNFDIVRKQDAAVRKAKDTRNDRKPWPTNMNARTRDIVVKGRKG